jgi:transposase-like protein
MNLYSLAKTFPTEEHALAYWIKVRWPDGVKCVACDNAKVYLIETKGTTGKAYRKFECSDCGLHFSPTANTIFHDSHLPLQKWFMAIALMTEAKKGISASQLGRHLQVSYKTAWHLCQRIREAMQEPKGLKLGGESVTVEIDETYIGGTKRGQGVRAGKRSKTVVVGMAERDGSIYLKTVKSSKERHVRPVIASKLDRKTEKVVTDGDLKYRSMFPADRHVRGNHKRELRNKNWTSTQTIENAFSLFKRGIVGNYHQLGTEHLDRYLNEFCWRYNRRRMQPWLFDMVLTNMTTTKPLPYKVLVDDGF